MDILLKYFPDLTATHKNQFSEIVNLYKFWNNKINVISRKDIDNLLERHILHSLSIAKVVDFNSDTKILDVGTGGGFPGIPLAILFPDSEFYLIDSILKKVKVVNAISNQIGLSNIVARQIRVEELKKKFDFIVSRAVTSLPDFYKMVYKSLLKGYECNLANGILYLKGGDFTTELKRLAKPYKIFNISDYFDEEFFESKKIVYIPFN